MKSVVQPLSRLPINYRYPKERQVGIYHARVA